VGKESETGKTLSFLLQHPRRYVVSRIAGRAEQLNSFGQLFSILASPMFSPNERLKFTENRFPSHQTWFLFIALVGFR
jgi:hypothetical protein